MIQQRPADRATQEAPGGYRRSQRVCRGGGAVDGASVLVRECDILIPAAVERVIDEFNTTQVPPSWSSRLPTVQRHLRPMRSCAIAESLSCRISTSTPAVWWSASLRVGQKSNSHSLWSDGTAPSRGKPQDPGALALQTIPGASFPLETASSFLEGRGRSIWFARGSTTLCGQPTGRSGAIWNVKSEIPRLEDRSLLDRHQSVRRCLQCNRHFQQGVDHAYARALFGPTLVLFGGD